MKVSLLPATPPLNDAEGPLAVMEVRGRSENTERRTQAAVGGEQVWELVALGTVVPAAGAVAPGGGAEAQGPLVVGGHHRTWGGGGEGGLDLRGSTLFFWAYSLKELEDR